MRITLLGALAIIGVVAVFILLLRLNAASSQPGNGPKNPQRNSPPMPSRSGH